MSEGAPIPKRFSERLWDLDWTAALPWELDGIRVVLGTNEEANAFMTQNVEMFGRDADDARFVTEKITPAKQRFYAEMDIFLFQIESRTIGVATAHPTDWATYYMRSFAILPEFRERSFLTDYNRRFIEFLRSIPAITRFVVETSVGNRAVLRMFVAQGYTLTSTVNSERWGTLARFTRFLNEENEAAFERQFVRLGPIGRAGRR